MKTFLKILAWLAGIAVVIIAVLMFIGTKALNAAEEKYTSDCMLVANEQTTAPLAKLTCDCATERFITGMQRSGNGNEIGRWYGGSMTFEDLLTNYYGLGQVTNDIKQCHAMAKSKLK